MSARVLALVAPHGVSGVSSATAALVASRELLADDWALAVVGNEGAAAGGLSTAGGGTGPGAGGAPGALRVTWAPGAAPVERVRAVRDAIVRSGARVVAPNFLVEGFVGAALLQHRGVRCAMLCHGSELSAENLYERCVPLAHACRGVSAGIAGRARAYAGPGCGVGVLSTGVRVPGRFDPAPGARDAGSPLRLLYAAWLDERNKRALDLASLCDALHALGTAFTLTVTGRGPAEAELRRRLAGHLACGRASMPGVTAHADMPALIDAHDLVLLVSQREGTPVIVMEAMARGRGVAITTGCGGVLGAVRDGREGIVVPVGDMRGLARRLAEVAADRALLGRLGSAAQAAAREHFDLRALAPRYDAWVREAIDAPSRVDPPEPQRIRAEWDRLRAAMELIGPSEPGDLRALLLEWLTDLGVPGAAAAGSSAARGGEAELVVPGVGAMPITDPGRPDLGGRLLRAAVDRLGRRFAPRQPRIALYGAGRHTRRQERVVRGCDAIVAIVDDGAGVDAGVPRELFGRPVIAPSQVDRHGIDAVVVSSDEYERVMLERAAGVSGRAGWAGGRPVVGPYAELAAWWEREAGGGVGPAEKPA